MARIFREMLEEASGDEPLSVFVDAVDQLGQDDPARSLAWLAGALPSHCRVVVSTTELTAALAQCAAIQIDPLAEAEAVAALDHWLAAARRTLRPAQRNTLMTRSRAAACRCI